MIEELKQNIDKYTQSIEKITEKYNNKQKKESEQERRKKSQQKAKKQLQEDKKNRKTNNSKDSVSLAKKGYDEKITDNLKEEQSKGFEKNRLRNPNHENYDKDREAFLNQKSNKQSQNNNSKNISLNRITQENKRRVVEQKQQQKNKGLQL